MPTITDNNGNMEPEEEDMDLDEDHDGRNGSEEETASGSGEGEEDHEEEYEDEGGSSEMDEDECDKRKNECIDDMNELSSQFCKLKDQLFSERQQQLEHKLKELDRGTDPEYLYRLKHLEDTKEHRQQVANILSKYKLSAIQEKFQAEELAAVQHMKSEKGLAFDQLKMDLEDKIKRLEDDRHNIDINSEFETQYQKKKKKHDSLTSDRRKKPVQVSGPYIIYMLHEEEIIDDWTSIKRATKQQAQRRKVESTNPSSRWSTFVSRETRPADSDSGSDI